MGYSVVNMYWMDIFYLKQWLLIMPEKDYMLAMANSQCQLKYFFLYIR